MQNPEGEFYEVNYSPDSQWITYTKSGANNMSVIYVYHLTSGKEYPVTEKWYNSSSPVSAQMENTSYSVPKEIFIPFTARQSGTMPIIVWKSLYGHARQ